MRLRRYKKTMALLTILLGLVIFAIPYVSIVWSDWTSEGDKLRTKEQIATMPEEKKARLLEEATHYNAGLRTDSPNAIDPFAVEGIESKKPVDAWGRDDVVGYLSIPKIGEDLPLYLGATQDHLALGAAQIDGTAIPMGVVEERPVIAGHRGYYSRMMFRHLDKLDVGDVILLNCFGKDMVYEIYESVDIWPTENEALAPIADQDSLTLLTCTPYPRNNKRMLVNAKRMEESAEQAYLIGSSGNDPGTQPPASDAQTLPVESKLQISGEVQLRKVVFSVVAVATSLAIAGIFVLAVRTFVQENRKKRSMTKTHTR